MARIYKSTGSELTNKQEIFVKSYIANGFNGTRAAIDAGYSKHCAGAIGVENLTKPLIKSYLRRYMSEIADKVGLTSEKVLKRVNDCINLDEEAHGNTVLKACELAGKHLKLFTDKTETEISVKTHEEWLDEIGKDI